MQKVVGVRRLSARSGEPQKRAVRSTKETKTKISAKKEKFNCALCFAGQRYVLPNNSTTKILPKMRREMVM